MENTKRAVPQSVLVAAVALTVYGLALLFVYPWWAVVIVYILVLLLLLKAESFGVAAFTIISLGLLTKLAAIINHGDHDGLGGIPILFSVFSMLPILITMLYVLVRYIRFMRSGKLKNS